MKKITAKVITISSQILVVSIFLVLLFSSKGSNNKLVIVNNNNFDKMADSTLSLFKEEEMLTSASSDDVIVSLTDDEDQDEESTAVVKEKEPTTEQAKLEEKQPMLNLFYDNPVIGDPYYGKITGYGPDCYGCTTGCTRTGHNLYNSIYYEDSEYGTVRILAADPSFGKYAIFRVSNVPGMDPFIGIVLDTGGNVGFGKGTLFDLAFATESDPIVYSISGSSDVKFELLREGVSW